MSSRLPNRESVTTIAPDGSRIFLHPADVTGRFTWLRRAVAVVLVAVYFSLPFLTIGGNPAVFFDVLERRFHFFGLTFVAQDFWLGFFLLSGFGFALFVVSAMFGRLWCGWACPHSVFLEQVYRPIERLLEGPPVRRRKLDALSWAHPEKWIRRGSKLLIFFVFSTVIAHFFIAYFLSLPQLWSWMRSGPTAHPQAFLFVTVTSGLIFLNFAWFREQLCLVICPYGRLQSVLMDDETIVIGYDEKREEPRGKSRGDNRGDFGDCVNCFRCVQVCPTGIDIRQGLQIECIGCANCIDACDAIMDHHNRPRGLIRYDSQSGLEARQRRFLRPRLALYTLLFLLGSGAMTYSIFQIRPVHFQVMRMQGMPYFLSESALRNQFQVRIINRSAQPAELQIEVEASNKELAATGFVGPFTASPASDEIRTLVISLDREAWTGRFTTDVVVHGQTANGRTFRITRKVEFLGPDPRTLQHSGQETHP